jgi:hypothetical protein
MYLYNVNNMYTHMHMCMYVCMYVYVHVHIYLYSDILCAFCYIICVYWIYVIAL